MVGLHGLAAVVDHRERLELVSRTVSNEPTLVRWPHRSASRSWSHMPIPESAWLFTIEPSRYRGTAATGGPRRRQGYVDIPPPTVDPGRAPAVMFLAAIGSATDAATTHKVDS